MAVFDSGKRIHSRLVGVALDGNFPSYLEKGNTKAIFVCFLSSGSTNLHFLFTLSTVQAAKFY